MCRNERPPVRCLELTLLLARQCRAPEHLAGSKFSLSSSAGWARGKGCTTSTVSDKFRRLSTSAMSFLDFYAEVHAARLATTCREVGDEMDRLVSAATTKEKPSVMRCKKYIADLQIVVDEIAAFDKYADEQVRRNFRDVE